MIKFPTTHEINCDLSTFWKVYLDKAFNERLYMEGLSYSEFTITEMRETDSKLLSKWTAKPNWSLPGPVTKLLGPGFYYVAENHLDKQSKKLAVKLMPSTLTDKLRLESSSMAKPIGDTRMIWSTDSVIDVKIFGVAGLIESTLKEQLCKEYDETAVFMNKWIADGKVS